jgi:hypothetical protein
MRARAAVATRDRFPLQTHLRRTWRQIGVFLIVCFRACPQGLNYKLCNLYHRPPVMGHFTILFKRKKNLRAILCCGGP